METGQCADTCWDEGDEGEKGDEGDEGEKGDEGEERTRKGARIKGRSGPG